MVPGTPVPYELIPVTVVEALSSLRPQLDRLRRRQWRVLIMGPTSPRERDEAATFAARLLDLADALEGRD